MEYYYYGTNLVGSECIKKYGVLWNKVIPNWKSTIYSKFCQTICNCKGIIITTYPLTPDYIKEYELIILTEKQEQIVDSVYKVRVQNEKDKCKRNKRIKCIKGV